LALLPVGLFLLHPLNTQAVTYVVQRMASLAALFTLLAFASYLAARYGRSARSRWWYVAALIFWMLGIGSKENAVLLLPVILLYEICFFRGQWRQRIDRQDMVPQLDGRRVGCFCCRGDCCCRARYGINRSDPAHERLSVA
jgi:hypothetical protein